VGVYDPRNGDRLTLASGENHLLLAAPLRVKLAAARFTVERNSQGGPIGVQRSRAEEREPPSTSCCHEICCDEIA
jgi:hypothetical protein